MTVHEEAWKLIKNSRPQFNLLSFEQFLSLFVGWTIYPVIKNSAVVAAIVSKGNESHVSCLNGYNGKWFSRKVFDATIGKQIRQYGTAITSCFIDSPNKDFIRRLGYIYKTTLNGIEYYEATKESTVFIKK